MQWITETSVKGEKHDSACVSKLENASWVMDAASIMVVHTRWAIQRVASPMER